MDKNLTPPSTPPPITPNPIQAGMPQENKTDVMGIISIVCAFIGFQLPGFIIGLIGAKKAKEEGRPVTLSKIGWILNLVFMILTIIAIILLVTLGIIGASTASETAKNSSSSSQSRSDEYEEETSSQKDFKKGETAQFGKFDVKITSATRNYVPESEYRRAPAGKELVVLDLTITNKGEEADSVASYNYKVDENGVQTSASYVDGPGKRLESVQLAPGATVSGQVVFEVTAGATNLKLISDDYTYNPKTYRSEKINYSLEF